MYPHLGMCTLVQVPSEVRGVGFPGSGIIGGCESPGNPALMPTRAINVLVAELALQLWYCLIVSLGGTW